MQLIIIYILLHQIILIKSKNNLLIAYPLIITFTPKNIQKEYGYNNKRVVIHILKKQDFRISANKKIFISNQI